MDPADVGRRVLEGFARGRAKAHRLAREQAAPLERMVRLGLDEDILRGHGKRGRAGRIARRLRGRVSVCVRGEPRDWVTVRGVHKVLERIYRRSDSMVSNQPVMPNVFGED